MSIVLSLLYGAFVSAVVCLVGVVIKWARFQVLRREITAARDLIAQQLRKHSDLYQHIQMDSSKSLGGYNRRSVELLYEVHLLFCEVSGILQEVDRLLAKNTIEALVEAEQLLEGGHTEEGRNLFTDRFLLQANWAQAIELRLATVLANTRAYKARHNQVDSLIVSR